MTKVDDPIDEFQKAVRAVEAQSRNQLIEKAVLDTANDIVKGVIAKNAEKINEHLFEALKAAVRDEIEKSGKTIHQLVHEETRKFLDEKLDLLGTPFLTALEESELGHVPPKETGGGA